MVPLKDIDYDKLHGNIQHPTIYRREGTTNTKLLCLLQRFLTVTGIHIMVCNDNYTSLLMFDYFIKYLQEMNITSFATNKSNITITYDNSMVRFYSLQQFDVDRLRGLPITTLYNDIASINRYKYYDILNSLPGKITNEYTTEYGTDIYHCSSGYGRWVWQKREHSLEL